MSLQELKSQGVQSIAHLPAREAAVCDGNDRTLGGAKIVNHNFAEFPKSLAQGISESGNEIEKIFFLSWLQFRFSLSSHSLVFILSCDRRSDRNSLHLEVCI